MKKFLALLLTICFVLFTGVGVYAQPITAVNDEQVTVQIDEPNQATWFLLDFGQSIEGYTAV
ncbi:MAG: hypothetical protein JSW04_08350, partial [Desulfobacterales bacterium]